MILKLTIMNMKKQVYLISKIFENKFVIDFAIFYFY